MIGRAWLLALLFCLLILVLVGRLAQLQLIHGDRYALQVDDDRLVVEFVPAVRGRILDRHGTALVDNRTVYHAAVVLARLELTRRQRRRLPFWVLDGEQFDKLLADLSVRTMLPPAELRQLVIDELLSYPGVAIRRGKHRGEGRLGVIGLTQASLSALSGTDTDTTGLATLVEHGILTADPAIALQHEFFKRRSQQVQLLPAATVQRISKELAFRYDLPTDLVKARFLPFIPEIGLKAADDSVHWRWHLLSDEGRSRGEEALADFIGVEPRRLHDTLTDILQDERTGTSSADFVFLPESRAEASTLALPPQLTFQNFTVVGAPQPQERLYIIQGDLEDERHEGTGMFSALCRRLSQVLHTTESVRFPPDELALLITRHATRQSASRLQRRFRVHQMGLDRERVERFCSNLADRLTSNGQTTSVLEVERRITTVRRRADRDWAGSTRNDPLVLFYDLDRGDPEERTAIDLAGRGLGLADLPTGTRSDYIGVEPEIPGLRIVTDIGRTYPFDGHASHLTGWLKRLSAEIDRETALAYGLDPMGWVGDRMGLEYAYDRSLQGQVGKRQRLRVPGGFEPVAGGDRPAQAGNDLHITLDMELQVAAEQALSNWIDLAIELGTVPTRRVSIADLIAAKKNYGYGRAGMVLMDCHTGALLVSASTPSFKLSDIRHRYSELLDRKQNPGQPLHDYATWPSVAPGSTVKSLVGLAAYMDGVFQPGETIRTPGHMGRRGGGYHMPDHAPYGPLQGGNNWTMEEALQESSNSFFSTLAERLGDRRLKEWYERFGVARIHSVDITWQRAGTFAWSGNIKQVRPREARWNRYDTWSMGIGQFIVPCASPLQLVTSAACIANGGTILRPFLAERAADQAVAERLDIAPAALVALQRGMERVTDRAGTASKLRLGGEWSDIKVAAKTGTSEWGPTHARKPDNAWLIGYAPADKPEVAFAICVIAAGTSGGRACSPIAKRVLEAYFDRTRNYRPPVLRDLDESLSRPPLLQ